MFITEERKEEIKRNIMLNFDQVMAIEIQEILEELSREVSRGAKAAKLTT